MYPEVSEESVTVLRANGFSESYELCRDFLDI